MVPLTMYVNLIMGYFTRSAEPIQIGDVFVDIFTFKTALWATIPATIIWLASRAFEARITELEEHIKTMEEFEDLEDRRIKKLEEHVEILEQEMHPPISEPSNTEED